MSMSEKANRKELFIAKVTEEYQKEVEKLIDEAKKEVSLLIERIEDFERDYFKRNGCFHDRYEKYDIQSLPKRAVAEVMKFIESQGYKPEISDKGNLLYISW